MVKKKPVVEEVVPEPVVVPDPAPKLEHLKKLLEKTEKKEDIQMSQVLLLAY